MTDDEFWALLAEKLRAYPPVSRKEFLAWRRGAATTPRGLRLYLIKWEAEGYCGGVPVWLKNELKYLDVDLNFHREVGTRIQWFRIAEEEYNGVDEDELWWRSGRDNETRLPSERLGKGGMRDGG